MDTNQSAEASAEAAGSESSTSEAKTQDPIKQMKGEWNRKFSKINEKLDALLSGRANASQAVEETPEVEADVKQYVDTKFNHQKQVDAWQKAQEMFPELNQESENFDEKFFKAVDAEFSTTLRNDPMGPLKAAKLAALEMGKIEQLTQNKILKDEARRSRILSEGGTGSRDVKKESDPSKTFNRTGLARLGIDSEKLAKRMKANPDKYEGL